ncbi:titin-like isoform X2 [Amphiura filiformis]|uniref:titin-like isoform X2 n=1 Tax=Amphiura filiformis TaxID=82378 RepID=UPI003B21B201
MQAGIQRTLEIDEHGLPDTHVEAVEQTYPAPHFTIGFDDVNVNEGQDASFACKVEPTDDPKLEVQWLRNGEPIEAGSKYIMKFEFGVASMLIKWSYPEDSGVIMCRAKNRSGVDETQGNFVCEGKEAIVRRSQLSKEMQAGIQRTLDLDEHGLPVSDFADVPETFPAPKFTHALNNVEIAEGSDAHFTCRVEPASDPKLEIEWLRNGQPIEAGSKYIMKFEFGITTMYIKGPYVEDSGVITCRAKNLSGVDETQGNFMCQSKLTYPAPHFTIGFDDVNVNEGQDASFACKVEPTDDPNLEVQWLRNGEPITAGSKYIIKFEFGVATMLIKWSYPEDSGVIMCRATNRSGVDETQGNFVCEGKEAIVRKSQLSKEMQAGIQSTLDLDEHGLPLADFADVPETFPAPKFTHALNNVEIAEGSDAHFTCRVEPASDPKLEIEWLRNGQPIEAGSKYIMKFEFGITTMYIKGPYVEDSGVITCRAKNLSGVDESMGNFMCQSKLTYPAPHFTIGFDDVNVNEGQDASFACKVEPTDDPKLEVQWLRNGEPITAGSKYIIKFEFGVATMLIKWSYPEDSGVIMCRATNRSGVDETQGNFVCEGKEAIVRKSQLSKEMQAGIQSTLDLDEHGLPLADFADVPETFPAPKFTHSLNNVEIAEGSDAHFTCRVEPASDPKLEIEWLRNGQPIEAGSKYIMKFEFGITTMYIKGPYVEDSGVITCRAKNLSGVDETQGNFMCQSKLTYPAPHFTIGFDDVNVNEGQDASFACKVEPTDDPNLEVQWLRNGEPITAGSKYIIKFEFGVATMLIKWSYPEDSGVIMCRATNRSGVDETKGNFVCEGKEAIVRKSQLSKEMQAGIQSTLDLDEHGLPLADFADVPETFPAPKFTHALNNVEIAEGSDAHFTCRVEPASDPKLEIEWLRNGQPIEAGSKYIMKFEFGITTMYIKGPYVEDSGVITCRAKNLSGVDETQGNFMCQSKLTYPAPHFTIGFDDVNVNEGQDASFACKVEPTDDPKLEVQWLRNGEPITAGSKYIIKFEFGVATMLIKWSYPEDSGVIMCRATNRSGADETQGNFVCEGKEAIVRKSQLSKEMQAGIQRTLDLDEHGLPLADFADVPETFPAPKFTHALNNVEIAEGSDAHFTCRVEPASDPKLEIEWLRNGQPIEAGSKYIMKFEFGITTMYIKGPYVEDSGVITCRAKNLSGVDETQGNFVCQSKLTYPAPHFTIGFDDVNVNEGQDASFACKVEPTDDPNLEVQWLRNGEPITAGSKYIIKFEFGVATMLIKWSYPEDSGVIMCRATNRSGVDETKGNFVCEGKEAIVRKSQLSKEMQAGIQSTLDLDEHGLPLADFADVPETFPAPKFTHSLNNVEIAEGSDAHFTCRVEPASDPKLEIEWLRNGQPIEAGSKYIMKFEFGITTMYIKGPYVEDSGVITCRAKNLSGVDETQGNFVCQSKLTYPAPHFTIGFDDVNVNEGQDASFACKVEPTDDPKLEVQWLRNGEPITAGSKYIIKFEFGLASMLIKWSYPEDSGVIMCRATNRSGVDETQGNFVCQGKEAIVRRSQLSKEMQAGIQRTLDQDEGWGRPTDFADVPETFTAPKFTHPLNNEEIAEGSDAHFTCRVEPASDPKLEIEWLRNGEPITAGSKFIMKFEFGITSMHIKGPYSEDSGVIMCRAKNLSGVDETQGNFVCIGKETVMRQSLLPPEMQAGLQKTLDMDEGRGLPVTHLADLDKIDTYPAPKFTIGLNDVTINEGYDAHFACKVEPMSDSGLEVEWFRNGQPLVAGSKYIQKFEFGVASMHMKSPYSEDSGTISVRAKNKEGTHETQGKFVCKGKDLIQRDSQLPDGMQAGIQRTLEMDQGLYGAEPTSGIHAEPYEDIHAPPMFVVELNPVIVNEGQNAHFACRVDPAGDGSMKVVWLKDGKPVLTGSRIQARFEFGVCVLDMKGALPEDEGVITCKATNKEGAAESVASLQVKPRDAVITDSQLPEDMRAGIEKTLAYEEQLGLMIKESEIFEEPPSKPDFITFPEPLCVVEGESARFTTRLSGNPTPRVLWYKDNGILANGRRMKIWFDGLHYLEIPKTRPSDSGTIRVIGRNRNGVIKSETQLEVLRRDDPHIQLKPTHRGFKTGVEPPQHPELKHIYDIEKGHYVAVPRKATTNALYVSDHSGSEGQPKVQAPSQHPSQPPVQHKPVQPAQTQQQHAQPIQQQQPPQQQQQQRPPQPQQQQPPAQQAAPKQQPPAQQAAPKQQPPAQQAAPKQQPPTPAPKQQPPAQQAAPQQQPPAQQAAPSQQPQKPEFLYKLESTSAVLGEPARFSVRLAQSVPTPEVFWYKNRQKLAPQSHIKVLSDEGVHTLLFLEAKQEDQGIYHCEARNQLGSINCGAQLRVDSHDPGLHGKPQTAPVIHASFTDVDVYEGTPVEFICHVSGNPEPTINWYLNDAIIKPSRYFMMIYQDGAARLLINEVFPEDEGMYKCEAVNPKGRVSCSGKLTVAGTAPDKDKK